MSKEGKRIMQLAITSDDVAAAHRARAAHCFSVTSCPVFQTLKRSGVPVGTVLVRRVYDEAGNELPPLPAPAQAVTFRHPTQWDESIVGVTFEYPCPDAHTHGAVRDPTRSMG